jgi:transcription-repair coupling factor (superfamily II helicase)
MDEVVKHLANIVPEIKVVRAHGQMSASELDEIMNDFYDGKFDVLLATTIVESGLDIPSANTIVIHKADMFGLAQLYQLRGRVGRSNTRAYAYLTLPPKRIPTKEATKRLEVMQSLDSLGAGFSVASHDMDIRGFGNLVGEQQSGQVREVGIELYQDMLKETVDQIKKEKMAVDSIHQAVDDIGHWSPIINLGISALIPEEYISDLQLRLGLYKRISFLQSDDDVENFAAELIDRFGKFPEEVENLLDIIKVKIICKQAFIAKLDANSKGITLAFKNDSFPNPDNLINYVTKRMTKFRIRGDNKLVIMKATQDIHQRIKDVKEEVGQIIDLL